MSLGTPIFSAACKFTGIDAALEHVPNAVTVGGIIAPQNAFNPFLPPAISAYKEYTTM